MIRKHNSSKRRRPAGMRLKMFGYMALFIAIVIAVLWLFQIILLDDIYRGTVKAETKGVADAITVASKLDRESLRSRVYSLAADHSTCVSVYEISGSKGKEIISAHSQNLCVIHSRLLNESFLADIYANANGKSAYIETVEGSALGEGSILCSRVIPDGSADLLIIVNTPLASVDATVRTLHLQFGFITVILLVVAAIMAFVISQRFTRPVAAMNKEAKKLAVGNYDVNFEGGDFLETAELGRTLNYAAGELSKLDTMQKELISNISHDLRTPLTMISGYSEVMRDIPGEMTAENMQIIIDETKRLSSLVNDMLDLSRLTGGARRLNTTVFSLTECVSSTIDRYAHLTEKDGYKITFDFRESVFVAADEILILQVVYNLISNAVNYTGDDKLIHIAQTVENGMCRISVSDTGDGIAEEKLPHIWDRYYRTGDFHKRAVMGTGLGLSIVKGALILHNAPFGVSSTPGVGSTFWFELPVISDTNQSSSI
ncbi:MAG: HAMP domain-containing histidine kinase [Clostridia bacterium]|nr:HAMP domain-containing histidine kinase [Clostridia bacterium]